MSAADAQVGGRAAGPRRVPFSWKPVRVAAFYGGLLGLWQLLAVAEMWEPYLFPAPGDVRDSLWRNVESGLLWEAMQVSLKRMAIGYLLSIGVGMAVGVAMGTLRWVDETVGSVVLGLQSLPSVTWFPLALLWFGLNENAVIFVVLMGSVNAIAISARSGVRDIPPLLLRASAMFGGRPWQRLVYVILPAMLPAMVQGLKLGWSFAWRSLLAAELLFASISLGHLLNIGRELNDVSQLFAMMGVIIAIGIVADRVLFGQMERWVGERWGLRRG